MSADNILLDLSASFKEIKSVDIVFIALSLYFMLRES